MIPQNKDFCVENICLGFIFLWLPKAKIQFERTKKDEFPFLFSYFVLFLMCFAKNVKLKNKRHSLAYPSSVVEQCALPGYQDILFCHLRFICDSGVEPVAWLALRKVSQGNLLENTLVSVQVQFSHSVQTFRSETCVIVVLSVVLPACSIVVSTTLTFIKFIPWCLEKRIGVVSLKDVGFQYSCHSVVFYQQGCASNHSHRHSPGLQTNESEDRAKSSQAVEMDAIH